MSDTQYFQTRMGQRFYERTVPELVRQVQRLASAMEGRGAKPAAPVPSQATPALERIALEELGIETLEERHSDRLDFHEIGVVGLRRALERAYELGRRATAG